ncbi:hypothetical protein ACFL2V_00075 [Pseudomonadota bacterium]
MNAPAQQNIFDGIAANISELQKRLSGDAGENIAQIGNADGVIPDLARETLTAMADVLTWLYQICLSVEKQVINIDAAVAVVETLSDAVIALGDGLNSERIPDAFGSSKQIIERIAENISKGGRTLESATELLTALPTPEALRSIKVEIEKSLGSRVKPSEEEQGSLGALLEDIKR